MSRLKLAVSLGRAAVFLCVLIQAANTWAARPAGGSVARALTLADLGLSQPVSLNSRNFEQHFYFPMPQGVALQNSHFEIHGTYYHPFNEAAAVTLLVNGAPIFTQKLPNASANHALPDAGEDIPPLSGEHMDEREGNFDVSLPLQGLPAQGEFLDLGVVLSSQIDASHCIDERGRGNELSIDPKATQLSYSFDGNSARDIRSLLTTLPHRPVILLPQKKLTAVQFKAALRLSQAFSRMGLQPEFSAVPQLGDVVDTASLADSAISSNLAIPEAMANAIAQHRPYEIAQPIEITVWLALRIMSPNGLAQAVIDPTRTREALLAALQGMAVESALSNQLWLYLRQYGSDSWLPKATLNNANVRVSMLAEQPVLVLEGDNMGKGIDLVATTWHQIAGSRELALLSSQPLTDKDSALPHIHFAANLPVQNVGQSAEWVVPIQLNHLPDGKWPDLFELNLMAAPSGDGLSPVVSVFMNDNLLTAQSLRTDGEITRLRARIPLYALRMNNLLRVEIRRRNAGGHCSGAAQSFPVQLLPSSVMTLRDAKKAT